MKLCTARSASASAFSFRRAKYSAKARSSIVGEFGQAFVEHDAIFECGVHALTVERHDGVGGVADERDFVFVEPRRATNRHERAGRIGFEIFEQRRHQRHGIGKFFLEKAADFVVGLGRLETARPFEFPKERAGERAIGVRQRDHHETFARPDVERFLFHSPRTIRRRRNGQLLVAVREITLVVFEARDFLLHRLADGGESAIDADDGVARAWIT